MSIKTLLYIPNLLISSIEKPFNSLFALLWSFWTIEDQKTYCYFWFAQTVEFQKYLWTSWVVIDDLKDYKVEKWNMTFLDYFFLFIYWMFYSFCLFLLLKPKE